MRRFTLRLPETLYRQLEDLAQNESVALNQYIVFALTRQVTLSYTVQPVSESGLREQRAAYAALLQSLGSGSAAAIERALAERDSAEPEPGLTQEVVQALRERIARQPAADGK